MVTFLLSANVTRTLPPGVSPIVFRILAGITTWPLAESLTIGITVHLFPRMLNIINQSVTFDKEGVKDDPRAPWGYQGVLLSDRVAAGARFIAPAGPRDSRERCGVSLQRGIAYSSEEVLR